MALFGLASIGVRRTFDTTTVVEVSNVFVTVKNELDSSWIQCDNRGISAAVVPAKPDAVNEKST